MHDIRIIDLIPLHDLMTLAVFEDKTIGQVDAKLLRNTHDELNPPRWPHLRPETREICKDSIAALRQEIDHSEFAENLGSEVITVEVDEPLYSDFIQWCRVRGVEVERVLQAFIRFCTEENKDVIEEWLNTAHRKAMLDAILYANEHIFTQEQVEQDFDSILDVVAGGTSPVLIKAFNGSELLLFGWEDYWARFSFFEPEGERARIEALCAERRTAENHQGSNANEQKNRISLPAQDGP